MSEIRPIDWTGQQPPRYEPGSLPAHVAIIMDGNGRWANQRGLTRTQGHAAGEELPALLALTDVAPVALPHRIRGRAHVAGWLTALPDGDAAAAGIRPPAPNDLAGLCPETGTTLLRLRLPAGIARYVVAKGSLAVDGVSLTVAEIDGDEVTIGLIPETLERTTLGRREVGDGVNLEVDVLAKYVERLLVPSGQEPPADGPRRAERSE